MWYFCPLLWFCKQKCKQGLKLWSFEPIHSTLGLHICEVLSLFIHHLDCTFVKFWVYSFTTWTTHLWSFESIHSPLGLHICGVLSIHSPLGLHICEVLSLFIHHLDCTFVESWVYSFTTWMAHLWSFESIHSPLGLHIWEVLSLIHSPLGWHISHC
jgi:hypothetical protein